MLNELYGLSNILKDIKIETEEWHREYKPLPKASKKAPCYRIWLSNDGKVSNVEELNAELVQTLRKYGNNQGTIPAFNIAPLYRITDEQKKKKLENINKDNSLFDFNEIKSWCVEDNWRDSLIRKVNLCLKDTSLRLLDLTEKYGYGENNALISLIQLMSNLSTQKEYNLRSALKNYLFEKLKKREDINIALSMLFHEGNPAAKEPDKDSGMLSVILDITDWQQYGHPVASEYTTALINDILLKSEQSENSTAASNGESDAFGMPFSHVGEPMPGVKLNGFEVTLRSMFSGQPCQYRYGKIEDDSYPITKINRSHIKKSLEWISQADKEGSTWKQADQNEIIFAYPSKISPVPLKFASIFGQQQENEEKRTAARFEQIAQEFIKTLKGISPEDKPDNIQIFSIRKMDKARSKVVFTRNCSPEWFIQSAESWQSGCRNIPDIWFLENLTPFPLQVARIVNNVWKQDGKLANTGKTTVKRMQYYQGMELLLDPDQESIIHYYLEILLSHSSGLVKYAGNLQHGRLLYADKEKKTDINEKELALLMSVFGLFLYKCGHKKEDYMENTAYLVGQVLRISDELHALYCNCVRDGNIPPQLAGNSMFVTASEMPAQALSQLSTRMNPYISWAKQYRTKNISEKGKESWRAGWYLGLYEEVANKLHFALTNSTKFDDFSKAEVFIGYLATFPKRAKPSTDDAEVVNNTNVMEGDHYGQGN